MQCPICQSNNVQKCSVAHEQGTITTRTSGVGTGQSTGHVAQGGFTTFQHNHQVSSTSTATTAFAKRAAPPTHWFAIWRGNSVGSLVTVVAVYFLHGLANIIGVAEILAVPWLIVSLIGLALTYPKRRKYDEAERRWNAS